MVFSAMKELGVEAVFCVGDDLYDVLGPHRGVEAASRLHRGVLDAVAPRVGSICVEASRLVSRLVSRQHRGYIEATSRLHRG